jgi:hypothetical protein
MQGEPMLLLIDRPGIWPRQTLYNSIMDQGIRLRNSVDYKRKVISQELLICRGTIFINTATYLLLVRGHSRESRLNLVRTYRLPQQSRSCCDENFRALWRDIRPILVETLL